MESYDDPFMNFDSPKSPDDFFASESLEDIQSSQQTSPLKQNIEGKIFYFQCIETADSVILSVHELGRHKIRVYGYEPFAPKAFEVNSSLSMKSVNLKGWTENNGGCFVVESSEFRAKGIRFQGEMSSIRMSECKCESQSDPIVPDEQYGGTFTLSTESVVNLLNTVESHFPALLSTPTKGNNKTSQWKTSPVSPHSLCFGPQKNSMYEPLTPPQTSQTMDGSNCAFKVLMDCSSAHEYHGMMSMDSINGSCTPPLNWTPVPSPVLTPQGPSQKTRRTLVFPERARCLPQQSSCVSPLPPSIEEKQPGVALNFANAMLLNNAQQVSQVRVQVVPKQVEAKPFCPPFAYSSVVSVSKKTSQPPPAAPLKKVPPVPQLMPASSDEVIVTKTSVDNGIVDLDGVPCYSVLQLDGTKQLYVCESHFRREVQRYEGFQLDWTFLREDRNHAYYYKIWIYVNADLVKMPGAKNYEVTDDFSDDSRKIYKIMPMKLYTKCLDPQLDVFPFFYKNTTQYKRLSEEEKAEYVLCNDGPRPPFNQGPYKSHYYLKELCGSEMAELEIGYHQISRYYEFDKSTHAFNFSMEHYSRYLDTEKWISVVFAEERAERERQKQLKQKVYDIPKKANPSAVSKSKEINKKHSGVKKKSRVKKDLSGSDEPSLSEKDETDETSYTSDSESVDWEKYVQDLESGVDVQKDEKGKKKRKAWNPEGGFYDILSKVKKGKYPSDVKPDKEKKKTHERRSSSKRKSHQ